jgi:hypothetical protein
MMDKILSTINVGYFDNLSAKEIIKSKADDGWGIDAIVRDPNSPDSWVTFYKYETSITTLMKKKSNPTLRTLLMLFAGYGVYSFIAHVVNFIIWLTN